MIPKSINKICIFNNYVSTREIPPILYDILIQWYHQVKIVRFLEYDREDVLYIIICPANISYKIYQKGPMYYITYQVETYNSLKTPNYRQFLKEALYNWDFSSYNCSSDLSKELKLKYNPIGYHPALTHPDIRNSTRGYSDSHKDIDVLFLGYIGASPRRAQIKAQLDELKISNLFISTLDLPGMQRMIGRSKICIDIRQQDFITDVATLRMNILLSNQACIISEEVINTEDMELYRQGGVIFVPYDQMIKTIQKMLPDFERRYSAAVSSYEWYITHRKWENIFDFKREFPFQ